MLRKLCISLVVVMCFSSTPSNAKELIVKVGIAMDQTGPLATSGRKGVSSWQWFEEYLNNQVGGWKDSAGNTVPSGIYIGRMEAKTAGGKVFVKSVKMGLVR